MAKKKVSKGSTKKAPKTPKKKVAKTPKKKATKTSAKKSHKAPNKVADFARASRAIAKYGAEIRKLEGVKGIGIGPRFVKGKPTRERAIHLHVPTAEAKKYLRDNADALGLKKTYGGVRSDIIVSNFTPAAGAGGFQDGEPIVGDNGPGTLGTTVVANLNNNPTVVLITAAHVASSALPPAGNAVNIFQPGSATPIGTVERANYFRNEEVDAAYIVPSAPVPRPRRRTIRHLTASDEGKTVTMNGAVTNQSTGKIISLFYSGELSNTAEPITDHFLVQHPTQTFAVPGDSGSSVKLGAQLVGLLRAVDPLQRIAVVSKIDLVRAHAQQLGRGFQP